MVMRLPYLDWIAAYMARTPGDITDHDYVVQMFTAAEDADDTTGMTAVIGLLQYTTPQRLQYVLPYVVTDTQSQNNAKEK